MHAMVIGAGATGKAVAIALARAKHSVKVFDERVGSPGMAGGALMLWSNAVRALNELCATKDDLRRGETLLQGKGLVMRRMDFRTFEGAKLYSMPIKRLSDDAKAPSLLVDRQVLQDVLQREADALKVETKLGWEFWRYRAVGTRVEAEFRGQPPESGDVLLGAEGGRSRVRSRLFGPPRYRSTGQYVAFGYSTFASELAPPGVCYCLMDADHRFFAAGLPGWEGNEEFGVKPVWRTYWGASVPMGLATTGDGRGRRFPLEALREAFTGAAPDVGHILDGSNEPEGPKQPDGSTIRDEDAAARTPAPPPRWWAVESRDLAPGGTWHRDRVGLLGDAAHLMTYDLGQGQAMGFEDAVELGRCIERFPTDAVSALGAFERARRQRVGAITELSYRAAQVSTPGSDLLATLRDFATANFYAPVNERTMRFMLQGGPAMLRDLAVV